MDEIWLSDVPGSAAGAVLMEAPTLVSAQERGDYVELPGRSGSVWRTDGALEMVDLKAKLYVSEKSALSKVLNWIRAGTAVRWGRNAFEYRVEPGTLEIEVKPWEEFAGRFGWTIELDWSADPYRYRWPAVTAMRCGIGTQRLFNPGNTDAQPVIGLQGSGAAQLRIGAYVVDISAVPASGLVIDCRARIAYSMDGAEICTGLLTLTDIGGGKRWPVIGPGESTMNTSGGITSAWITPGWRDR